MTGRPSVVIAPGLTGLTGAPGVTSDRCYQCPVTGVTGDRCYQYPVTDRCDRSPVDPFLADRSDRSLEGLSTGRFDPDREDLSCDSVLPVGGSDRKA